MSREQADGAIEGGDDTRPSVDEPRVLLLMAPGRNRDLLVETLGRRYRVETTTDPTALETPFDCCVFDRQGLDRTEFSRIADLVETGRETGSAFLPFVLLVPAETADSVGTAVWDYVDDVIELPVGRAELLSRIDNLIQRRRTAVELESRSRKLEETVAELRLKERAMDRAPVGITITDPSRDDNPMVYVNDRFQELTGYDAEEVLGRNCRLLQGADTDPETRRLLRERIDAEQPVSVDIVNYRKNDQRFWQKLDVAPVRDEDGRVVNFVGFQTEITDRKIRERRLEVLNRVLSHNLKNKMNLIEGHVALLREELDRDGSLDSLGVIERAANDLMALGESVRRIDRIISTAKPADEPVSLRERIEQLVSVLRDRYPTATFDVTLPDTTCDVAVGGLTAALEEAMENAVRHNAEDAPAVEVRVDSRDEGWIDIEIEDDGPGIPEREVEVLEGGESPLNHAERLGLWQIYWIVTKAGGEFSVRDAESGGTVVTLSVPCRD
ncbi:PAS domain-containing protein [Haloplanus salinarum]|jgi:PAS domain S-box-containing protein|uniref:PAS domain-containing protein n=1 Tax=Haloplanus salinarum TaxID=1912324 RepID=UPI00214B3B56|nr:PAS domain-containing protein [Haloplanus salinarum]